jgi:demethoxyubiquinone hydroxylase (CLK1/Coq7/Cat5 family)
MSNHQRSERLVKTTLELKDVVMIVTVAISIASAFFLYDKRLAVLELNQARTTHVLEQMQQDNQRHEDEAVNRRELLNKEIGDIKTEIEILKLNQEVALGFNHRHPQAHKITE